MLMSSFGWGKYLKVNFNRLRNVSEKDKREGYLNRVIIQTDHAASTSLDTGVKKYV